MGDRFYRLARSSIAAVLRVSSMPVVIGAEHTRRAGAFLLAVTHTSPYDVPILIRHVQRPLDFLSVSEAFRRPFLARLYGGMNAFPLDRSRPDAGAVRAILERLRRGRVVALFPEGGLRAGPGSALGSRRIRPGLGRLAHLADVPIVPCVIANSACYSKPVNWLPLRRSRYGIGFGAPIAPSGLPAETEERFLDSLAAIASQLAARMT